MPFSQQESVKRKAESTLKRLLKRRLSTTDPIDDTNICSLNVEGVWDQLSSDVKDAYNREHYDEAIEHSNDVIHTLKEMLIKALKLRMNLWQKKGDLGQQLKNAVTLIEHAPRDSVGYISAAQVYSMRGQQNRVIAITSEGMHNISKADDGYETLKALYQNANARIAIRIDFLAQLPYDLACTIASYMPGKSRGACVKVSRTWRDRLLHYPKIWRICTIYPVSYDPTLQLLPKITTHIMELSIDCSSQLMFDKCMELLGYADFPNIEKLRVSTKYWDNNSHDWVLSNISKTLKELDLSFYGEFAASLPRLLIICENITKLKYYCWSTSKWFSVPTLPHTTMLKNIDVGCYHGMVQGNRLIGLFKHSPKLHVINLRSFDEGALPAIHQYCPELTILTLNVDDYTDVIDAVMDRISTKAHGLRHLLLYNIVSGAIVKPFLETHQKTIEELELVLYSEQQQATAMTGEHGIGDGADDWAFLSTLDYMPNIHRLSIYARNSSPIQEHNLLSMLSKCPSLYFLSLECFVRHGITKETLEVIGSLQKLNKLRISQCSLYAEATDDTNSTRNGNNLDSNKMTTPKQLFRKLRNLTHVEIGYCSGTTHAMMDIVANIPNLMLIAVRGMSTTMNVDMQEITSKLATLESLQQVEFDTVDLSPEALHEFDKDDVDCSMKQIVLRNIRNIDKFQARQVLSSSNISIAYFGHDVIFENNTSGEDDL